MLRFQNKIWNVTTWVFCNKMIKKIPPTTKRMISLVFLFIKIKTHLINTIFVVIASPKAEAIADIGECDCFGCLRLPPNDQAPIDETSSRNWFET